MPDPFVRPDVKAFLAMLNSVPGPKMHQMTPEQARAQYVQMRDLVEPPVGDLGEIRDLVIPGPRGDMPARLYDAKASREPGPVVVFFHGGGFTIGDLDTHASFTAEVARALDLPVIAVDYGLAPEAKWPAAPDDAEAAARWIAGNPTELGRAVTSLVLMGDSAGGNLTILTAIALRDAPAAVPVIAQVPIYPATDSSKPYASFDEFADGGFLLTRDSLKWLEDHYGADAQHLRTSPLTGDLQNLPPALIVTASLDPLRDQGRAYAAALALAGVAVTYREMLGTIHGFITLRQAIPSAQGDVATMLTLARPMITAAEAEPVMAQAAGQQGGGTMTDLPYRPCAGVMLLNRNGQVFVGQRLDNQLEAWQMPQGGIDKGEDAETAARRELGEETGIAPDLVELIAEAGRDFDYDLPPELAGKVWGGKYRGQRQRWFLFRFLGEDSAVDIATEHPEFRARRWADPSELEQLIVPFKRDLYREVISAFSTHLS